MKRRYAALLCGLLATAGGCSDFLDVNTNPNAPQSVTANLYLPPMLHWMVVGQQLDGVYVGRYTQEWFNVTPSSLGQWERMGYIANSDASAQQWRDVYWSFGQNLVDMMGKAEAEQRWDLLGVGQVLKAWGWQQLTDLHGEIIVKEAIDQSRFTFDYDSQEYAYQEVQRLLNEAIKNLQRTDGAVDPAYLAAGDKIYNGDRGKWLKFAYGLLALNLNHYSNKASYKPAEVIAAVDKSFQSNADDPLLTFPATSTDNADKNPLGRTRGNLTSTSSTGTNLRQTKFAVSLMDGTVFGVRDPRLTRILAPAPDSQYRGVDINVPQYGGLPANQRPNNLHGYPDAGGAGLPGRYIFDDKAKLPAMTYAQLQFVKAEAAYRMGDMQTALNAYRNGISAHIDFVNARNLDNNQTPTQITGAEKSAFLASPQIVPSADQLTLTHIMSQKYIAQYGWAHNEMWMDLRRYHYTDPDPVTQQQVFPGFAPPTNLFGDNGQKVVQRLRPRYNSEYVWNRPALDAIGGLALDFHTKPLWITQP